MRVVNRIAEAMNINGITLKELCEALERWEIEEKKKLIGLGKHFLSKKLRVTKNRTSILAFKNNPRDKKQPNAVTRKALAEVLGWQVAELFKILRK